MNKEEELVQELKKKNINLAIITETKKKLQGTKEVGEYIMIYSGVKQQQRAAAGVAILVDKKWKTKIQDYTIINERILQIRLKVERGNLTVIAVYAPEENRKEESEKFYNSLQETLEKINKNDYMIIGGDLNARIGNRPIEGVVGTNGESTLNENGKLLREFATHNRLKITNSFFRKKDIHKYTWTARGSKSIIDYIIVNNKLSSDVIDTTVQRGSDLYTDHYLVIAKIRIIAKWRKRINKNLQNNQSVYKTYLLQDESIKQLYQSRLQTYLLEMPTNIEINEEWGNISRMIHKAAEETLGKKKKFRKRTGLKIWNDEISVAVNEKQTAYIKLLQNRTLQNENDYKEKRNKVKSISKKLKEEHWDKLISNIEDDVHGRQEMAYKLMKYMNKEEREMANINVIEEHKWKEHYKMLWYNEEMKETIDKKENEVEEKVGIDLIDIKELQDVLKSFRNRKAPGIDNMNLELIKYGGTLLQFRYLHLINMCWQKKKIPEDWKKAKIISIFKKGIRSKCTNYRGISLLNAGYKIYAKILNNRLKIITDSLLLEDQCGFRKGRSCSDNIFVLKQILEKRKEFNYRTCLAFVDYEKAFDRINRNKLWIILENQGYPKHLIETIKSLYNNTTIILDLGFKQTEEILINQGVRQGCSLSPTLFNIYIDSMIRVWKPEIKPGIKIGNNYINNMLFADDQIIMQENEQDLQHSIHLLQKISKEYDLKISINKTKVMAWYGKHPMRIKIIVDDQPVEQVTSFVYLGCEISYSDDDDVKRKLHRFQYMCGTIRRTLRNKVRQETTMKFYKTMAVPVLMYGSETWVNKKKYQNAIQSSEMKFLRSVNKCTKLDKIKNEDIRKNLDIFSLNKKIQNNKERWKEHVLRMDENRFPKQALRYQIKGRRDPGRPRKRWAED